MRQILPGFFPVLKIAQPGNESVTPGFLLPSLFDLTKSSFCFLSGFLKLSSERVFHITLPALEERQNVPGAVRLCLCYLLRQRTSCPEQEQGDGKVCDQTDYEASRS